MPLELIADRPGHAVLREYEDPPLAAGEVRVTTQFSAVKHGTEFRDFRFDSADATDRWDPDLRLHRRGEPAAPRFPKKLGEGFVGIVTEVGDAVDTVQVSDRVYAHGSVADTHVIPVEHFSLRTVPPSVSNQNLVYDEAAMYALGGIRDGQVRLGERVAVFGLGAIGQMAVQMAKLSGARWVAASDPIERRRAAAVRHGADVVLDPAEVDVGLAIKQMTGSLGVDVSIETSSSHAALYDALRSTRFQGRVASTAYYTGPAQGLLLSGEWHRNQLTIISSRAAAPPQPREYSWDERIKPEVVALLEEGRLQAEDLVDPIVPMARAAEAYLELNEHPERSIKLGIDHTLSSA